jgi:hypothetical protein
MASGKEGKLPRDRNAAAAARLVALLGAAAEPGGDERAAKVVALAAERHASRARRKGKPARVGSASKPATYLHDRPTRSRVLNAFLHELGGASLVREEVHVPDEHTLAPRLLERARTYLGPLAAAAGWAEGALRIAEETVPITNELAARRFLRWARGAGGPGALAAIADDYAKHRRRAGAPEADDLLGAAIMAAFAGRLVAYAERLLGPRVRTEVKKTLEGFIEGARGRARRARALGPTNPPAGVGTAARRRTGLEGA